MNIEMYSYNVCDSFCLVYINRYYDEYWVDECQCYIHDYISLFYNMMTCEKQYYNCLAQNGNEDLKLHVALGIGEPWLSSIMLSTCSLVLYIS